MKTGPDVLDTAENESESVKNEIEAQRPRYRRKRARERKICKRDRAPSIPLKMSPGAQNVKTGLDALGTAENESRRVKHENRN
jgi:hypothetical protein